MHRFYVIPLLICWSLVSIGRTNAASAYQNATLNTDLKKIPSPPSFNCSDMVPVKFYLQKAKGDQELGSGGDYTVDSGILSFSNKRTIGGRYTCVGSATNRTYDIFVPAHADSMGKSKSVMYGDETKLTCTYYGYPKVKMFWMKDGDVSKMNKTNLKVETEEDDNHGVSTLTITNVQEDDRANYACMVEINTQGFASISNSTVLLRVKDKLAALWPFLGICAEVIVLCTIILIYERRRSKHSPEPEESEQSQDLINKDKSGKGDVKKRVAKT